MTFGLPVWLYMSILASIWLGFIGGCFYLAMRKRYLYKINGIGLAFAIMCGVRAFSEKSDMGDVIPWIVIGVLFEVFMTLLWLIQEKFMHRING